jgi:hypothetical protein
LFDGVTNRASADEKLKIMLPSFEDIVSRL